MMDGEIKTGRCRKLVSLFFFGLTCFLSSVFLWDCSTVECSVGADPIINDLARFPSSNCLQVKVETNNDFNQPSTMLIRIPSIECLLLSIPLLVHTNLLFEIEFVGLRHSLAFYVSKNLKGLYLCCCCCCC